MNIIFKKKPLLVLFIIVALFLGAGLVFYFLIIYFPSSSVLDSRNLPLVNSEFATKIYPHLLDLGKFFLTILLGIFVASITFSEKIVNFTSSSWWSKSLLILCWIFLLISIVSDGVGLVFLTDWYANELVEHTEDNIGIFELSSFCFAFAGISFGLALTSMLTGGIISIVSNINFNKTR